MYEAGRAMGAMYRTERFVDSIHFGCDMQSFYLRVDFRPKTKLPAKTVLRANFILPHHRAIIVPHLKPKLMKCELWETNPDSVPTKLGKVEQFRFEHIVEIGVSLKQLGWNQGDQVGFFIQLLDVDVELERHPEIGVLSFPVPDDEFEVQNWHV